MAWFLLLLLFFVCFYFSCCFFIYILFIMYIFIIYYIFIIIIFSKWYRVGTKDRFFHRGWGIGVEALIRKDSRVLGGAGHYISAGHSNWEVF